MPIIDRSICNACGTCVSFCNADSLVLYGEAMSVDKVFEKVKRDDIFYRANPRGGVTVSGGEALLQADFVRMLFEKCREADIHTCIETSGHADSRLVQKVLPVTDLVLFDLKQMDANLHQKYTGRTNSLDLKMQKKF